MPQYFLHQHGIDITKDLENCYVGSQESSIMNVHGKKTVAGVTWPPPWRLFQKDHPAEAAELKIAWETEPLINNSLMIRDDIPADQRHQIQEILTGLQASAAGNAVLAAMGTSRFIPASDKDYDVVRLYVQRFEREVRMVKTR
jgi:phosphonate transport system substrate-binding protein